VPRLAEDKDSIALKLDAADIPLRHAIAFVRSAGATRQRISELSEVARAFCLERLSYVGVTYTADGNAAWKLYMLIRPNQIWGSQRRC
jgi:hypothetical protein